MTRYLGWRIEDRSVVDSLVCCRNLKLDSSRGLKETKKKKKGMHALIIAKTRML